MVSICNQFAAFYQGWFHINSSDTHTSNPGASTISRLPISDSPVQHIDSQLVACHQCDLLLKKSTIPQGGVAKCPRCASSLYHNKKDSLNRALALALTGLVFFIPANTLPILSMSMIGREQEGIILSGALQLAKTGFVGVGALVFLFAIMIPAIQLLLIVVVLLCIKLNTGLSVAINLFKLQVKLRPWSMVEIYLLGTLLTCLKLMDDAEVTFGSGFYALVGLLLMSLLSAISLDTSQVWRKLDRNLYD